MSRSTEPFDRWPLSRVINAAGTMTSIGGSRVHTEVTTVVSRLLGEFVVIDELQSLANQKIAEITGAEAGCVTSCSAAAITLSVAAAITGDDLSAIDALPDTAHLQNRVAVQAGHLINFGGSVAQSIALSGAEVVSIGTAALCETWHLRQALKTGCAAAVFVVSHHTVREGEIPLDLFIEICQEFSVPVIVDMASEYELGKAIDLGATASICSAHKFLGGVTSGIVAGTQAFVRAVYLQHRGIGRSMKVGKEGIAGAIAALEVWDSRDVDAVFAREDQIVQLWKTQLESLPGLTVELHEDWTGNPITRIKLLIHPDETGVYAWELADRLGCRETRIMVRDDLLERQEIYLDPCNLTLEEAKIVATAIADELQRALQQGDGCTQSWSDVKRRRADKISAWPTAI